jgi:hypothetical protein
MQITCIPALWCASCCCCCCCCLFFFPYRLRLPLCGWSHWTSQRKSREYTDAAVALLASHSLLSNSQLHNNRTWKNIKGKSDSSSSGLLFFWGFSFIFGFSRSSLFTWFHLPSPSCIDSYRAHARRHISNYNRYAYVFHFLSLACCFSVLWLALIRPSASLFSRRLFNLLYIIIHLCAYIQFVSAICCRYITDWRSVSIPWKAPEGRYSKGFIFLRNMELNIEFITGEKETTKWLRGVKCRTKKERKKGLEYTYYVHAVERWKD